MGMSRIQKDSVAAVSPMNTGAQQEQTQSGPKTSPIPGTRFKYKSIQFTNAEYTYPAPVPDNQSYFNYSNTDLTKTAMF